MRAPNPASLFLAACLGLVATGCATTMPGAAPATGSAEIRDQLFKLQKDSARILERVETLAEKASGDQASPACAEAATKVDDLATEIRALEEQVLATQRRLDELFSEVRALRRTAPTGWAATAPAPAPGGTPGGAAAAAPADQQATAAAGQAGTGEANAPAGGAGPETPEESPVDVFNRAYADFSQGHYELALAGFQRVLQLDPNGPLSDDAQYWIGETYYTMQKYPEAAAAFDHLISAWPRSDHVRAAHLKKGLALFEGRRTTEGAIELQELIETWPGSDEARIAEDYLKRKGILQD